MGLFISTNSFGDGTSSYGRDAVAALQLVCSHFTVKTSPMRITSLALDHLTDSDGEYLETPLSKLAPYFGCFDHVYVGVADNHFADDIYCKALLNQSFVSEWVRRSEVAASRFESELGPKLDHMRWYLNYEAAGNYFSTGCNHFTPLQPPSPSAEPSVAPAVSAAAFTTAYVSMFSTLTERLVAIRNTSVMWSPTFNSPSADVTDRAALLGNVTELFRGVPLMREVANQDALGKYSLYNVTSRSFTYNLTCTDTVFYQALLHEAAAAAAEQGAPPAEVSVNMELFSRRNTLPKQSTITGDPEEHEKRKCCYARHNLSLGPSWELVDWYRSQFLPWDPDA
jgi:hypothetical protein